MDQNDMCAGFKNDALSASPVRQIFLCSCCRGMGRQAQLVWCNILGFWVVGTLTGYMLAFKAHLGVSGLWLGINAGVLSCGQLVHCSPQETELSRIYPVISQEFASRHQRHRHQVHKSFVCCLSARHDVPLLLLRKKEGKEARSVHSQFDILTS